MIRKKELIEKLERLPIWELIIYLAEVENRLLEIKKQGEVSSTKKNRNFDNIRQERNVYRTVLLAKLKEWNKDPSSFANEGITYDTATKFNKGDGINLLN